MTISRKEFLKIAQEQTGQDLSNRMKGTTTGLALKYLSEAILNPEKEVKIYDHVDIRMAHENCKRTLQSIVKELDLRGISFCHNTVKYTLDW